MKIVLKYIVSLLLVSSSALSNLKAQEDSTEMFFIVENMPLFENEDPAISFNRFLETNINQRDENIPDSITGRIVVHFTVDSTGRVIDPSIIRGLTKELDSLACQIVLSSPRWIPGTMGEKPVDVMFTFPIFINMERPVYIQNDLNKKKRKRFFKKKNYP